MATRAVAGSSKMTSSVLSATMPRSSAYAPTVGEESSVEQSVSSVRRRVEELAQRLTHPLAKQRSFASELAGDEPAEHTVRSSAGASDVARAARRRAAMAHLQTAAVLETLGYHDQAEVHWRAARADQEAAQGDSAGNAPTGLA
jgi:hypothetical protein